MISAMSQGVDDMIAYEGESCDQTGNVVTVEGTRLGMGVLPGLLPSLLAEGSCWWLQAASMSLSPDALCRGCTYSPYEGQMRISPHVSACL